MNTEPVWVVQSNLGSSNDISAIVQACADLGLPCECVTAIPFSNELPNIPTGRKTIFYGSSNFVTNIHRSGRWTPGAFFDEQLFRFSELQKHYGSDLLNDDARITTMGNLAQENFPPDKNIFIRPDGDLKEFAGSIFEFGDYCEWCEKLRPGGFSINLDTPIVVAEPKQIDHEWRLFMVNRKFITGSHYRAAGVQAVSSSVPPQVVAFAEHLAEKWSPAVAFVMDVAETQGRYSVLEINGLNSSGFYASDIKSIVQAVSQVIAASDLVIQACQSRE